MDVKQQETYKKFKNWDTGINTDILIILLLLIIIIIMLILLLVLILLCSSLIVAVGVLQKFVSF